MLQLMIEILPAVDVLDGAVVRLMHGDYDRATVYSSDPVAQAARWVAAGAGCVHVVDLAGARDGTIDRSLWTGLAQAGVPFQVGGGIRTAATANDALAAGARRVVMGTAAVWNPGELAAVDDPTRVVAAVDVKDGRATGTGWLDEGRALEEVLAALADRGIERVLVTGISRDGTMAGPAEDLLATVVGTGRFRVTASGGVGTLDDIDRVAALGCDEVIIGRAIYEGRFTVAEAVARGRMVG